MYTSNTKERNENTGAVDILRRYSTVSPQPYVVFVIFLFFVYFGIH